MRLRIGLLVAAVVTALIGTVLIAVYISSIRNEVKVGAKPVEVYVATRRISRGTSASELISKELVKKKKIPRQYVSDGAVKSLARLENKFLAVPLERGEQLTDSALSLPPSGLAIPKEKMAVAIPIDDLALISGRVKAGDRVSLLVTLLPGKEDKDVTKILLGRVLVLAVETGGQDSKTGGQDSKGGGQQSSLTVAVTPEEAEKLVFASEAGIVWLGLWPPGSKSEPQTPGQTLDSLF